MFRRRLLFFAGLLLALLVSPPSQLSAKDIIIVAKNQPLHWELQGVQSTGALKVPVKVGDVLRFVFSESLVFDHGITTENKTDQDKVQKRGQAANGLFLKELGQGDTRFGIDIVPEQPNEEITQLEVLSGFPPTFNLGCSVHKGNMKLILERSD
jgi:hypothetical protein